VLALLNEAARAKSPRFLSENASFQAAFIHGLRIHGFRQMKIRLGKKVPAKLDYVDDIIYLAKFGLGALPCK